MTKYPLCWPAGWKRTAAHQRKQAKFNTRVWKSSGSGESYRSWSNKTEVTIAQGTKRVLAELSMMGIHENDILISTNLELRLDGLPRSNQKEPSDPGVAVYWKKRKDAQHKVMAVDQYTKIADNLAAIAATLDAMRAIERHGGAMILERAFMGFEQLPEPNNWRHELGLITDKPVTLEEAKSAYQRLAMLHHPDKGGSHKRMSSLNRAWEDAQRELGQG